MVRGIDATEVKKKRMRLTEDKDYITETYLQCGKTVGTLLKKKNKRKK